MSIRIHASGGSTVKGIKTVAYRDNAVEPIEPVRLRRSFWCWLGLHRFTYVSETGGVDVLEHAFADEVCTATFACERCDEQRKMYVVNRTGMLAPRTRIHLRARGIKVRGDW